MAITNEQILNHDWLVGMYNDDYYPKKAVDKIKEILLEVCENIEQQHPKNLDELYLLTNQGVEKTNDLNDEFGENSEIETVARGYIADEFEYIAKAYGYIDADREELISARDW